MPKGIFKTANDYWQQGRLDQALTYYIQAKEDYAESNVIKNTATYSINRVLKQAQDEAEKFDLQIEPLTEHPNNPNNYKYDPKHPLPIISFTAISTRIERVVTTVQSITRQSLQPHSINLYISKEPYLVDEGISANNEHLKKLSSLGVNIYYTTNTGPYRKQYPIINQLRKAYADERTPIVTIDDDVIYPENILEDIMLALQENDSVVAHRGRKLTIGPSSIGDYKSFSPPSKKSSLLNMGTGKNGMAYRLSYFPTSLKQFVGPILAPTADDIWCKWATGCFCIPTTILEPAAAYNRSLDFKETAPQDKRSLYHSYNAKGTNDSAIKNIEHFFEFSLNSLHSLCKGLNNV